MLMSLLIYGGSLEFVAVEITKEPKTFRRTVSIPHFLTQRIKALRRERLKYRLTLGLIHALVEMRTYLDKDEQELKTLTDSAVYKLSRITDDAFEKLDLIPEF